MTGPIGDLLRTYGLLALRLGEAVAGRLGMEHVDMRALGLIAQAQRDGAPHTVTGLRERLGLSAGGTTLVLDRLERAGHVQRVRDSNDRRALRLLVTAEGAGAGRHHFGGLATRLEAVGAEFTEDELATVHRFLEAVVDMTGAHLEETLRREAGGEGKP
jgi:DNA-binding MarR family transcriptional regulator